MSISLAKHRITIEGGKNLSFVKSSNIGGKLDPRFLVIHYTAGQSAGAAVSWLASRESNASAHVVIGRDGSITQMVPFNRVAYHTGPSSWDGIQGLSPFSIGFELDNAGRLKRVGNSWVSWFGRAYPDDEVLVATHKHDKAEYGWHTYTEDQIQAAIELGAILFSRYKLLDVIGHDDISPRRKWDPGPAFPMQSFRSKLIGRKLEAPPILETTRTLHVRSGPGFKFRKILDKPLPEQTCIEILRRKEVWCFVDVLDEFEGDMDIQGWVHSRHLNNKEINEAIKRIGGDKQ